MKWVYFIKPIGMDGPIKIGCSQAPDNRRKTLETWCPFPLEIVTEIEGGFDLERRFHAAFRPSWIKHEWFNYSPELGAVIASIKRGEFDIDSLPSAVCGSLYRSARDNSRYTDEWRYEASVRARFRLRGHGWPFWNEDVKAILARGEGFLAHRDEFEALIERLDASKRSAAA